MRDIDNGLDTSICFLYDELIYCYSVQLYNVLLCYNLSFYSFATFCVGMRLLKLGMEAVGIIQHLSLQTIMQW